MFYSVLTVNNQLTLLYDLLDDQKTYSALSNDHYKKLKQLVKTITSNKRITDQDLQFILHEIYYYSIKGERVHSLQEHLNANKQNIEKWLKTIEDTKSKIS